MNMLNPIPVLSALGLIASIGLSFFPDKASPQVATGGVAVFSLMISYWFTQISERKKFQEEKKEIGRLAIRRAQNLSDDLDDFCAFIDQTNVDRHTLKFYLQSKARDALTSLDDIRDVSGLTSEKSREEKLGSGTGGANADSGDGDLVDANCVKCGYSNSVELPTIPNSTRQFHCVNCEYRQNVHRLPDGKFKVSDPHKRAGSIDLVTRPCPNCSAPVPSPAGLGPDQRFQRMCMSCAKALQYSHERRDLVLDEFEGQENFLDELPPFHSCQCGAGFVPYLSEVSTVGRFFACPRCCRAFRIGIPNQADAGE